MTQDTFIEAAGEIALAKARKLFGVRAPGSMSDRDIMVALGQFPPGDMTVRGREVMSSIRHSQAKKLRSLRDVKRNNPAMFTARPAYMQSHRSIPYGPGESAADLYYDAGMRLRQNKRGW